MSHFDEITALLYLDGELRGEREREISVHLSSCAECTQLLHTLQRESIWLRESLEWQEEALPSRLARTPRRPMTPWTRIAGIAAAGIAASGAYTLWSGLAEPWLAQASEAGFTQGNILATLLFSGAFWKGWDAMRNLIEFLAVASFGALLAWLVRRRRRELSLAGMILPIVAGLAVMGIAAMALPSSASAAEVVHGDPNYTLPAQQEVKSDLIVAAQHTRIDGDVNGDLIVWSRSITVNGRVKGDILAFGQELHVNGPVDGNVRVFGQSLTLEGSVEKT